MTQKTPYIRVMYNWQHPNWPNFTYGSAEISRLLQAYKDEEIYLRKVVASMDTDQQYEAFTALLVEEAAKSSKIEGELLSYEDLTSSILTNLNPSIFRSPVSDLRTRGIAELVVLNRRTFDLPLTETMLRDWHRTMQFYRKDLDVVGNYRAGSGPMQISSGPDYRREVHFEAPPSRDVPDMMHAFLHWFNVGSGSLLRHDIKSPLRAGIAHLWFESIHPFEDGNGRIGRVIIEKALAQGLNLDLPFSISSAIEASRKDYYAALRQGSKGVDATEWLECFLTILLRAVHTSKSIIEFTLQKSVYRKKYDQYFDDKQRKVIKRMLEEGPDGFKGGMSNRKYVHITRASPATAKRDLAKLVEVGALARYGAGRSTRYELNLF